MGCRATSVVTGLPSGYVKFRAGPSVFLPAFGMQPTTWPLITIGCSVGATSSIKDPISIGSTRPWWETDLLPKGSSRSEEHTSELQSLMRNSYAVFCLQKNKKNRFI